MRGHVLLVRCWDVVLWSSRTIVVAVESSRTDLADDVFDVTSLSALDVVEIE